MKKMSKLLGVMQVHLTRLKQYSNVRLNLCCTVDSPSIPAANEISGFELLRWSLLRRRGPCQSPRINMGSEDSNNPLARYGECPTCLYPVRPHISFQRSSRQRAVRACLPILAGLCFESCLAGLRFSRASGRIACSFESKEDSRKDSRSGVCT